MTKTQKILLSLIVVTGSYASYYAYRRSTKATAREKMVAQDLATLNDKNADAGKLEIALRRLAERQDPKARQILLERSKSTQKEIRASAVFSLGFFSDDNSTNEVAKFSDDPESTVRISALQGLGLRSTPARSAHFQKIFSRAESSPSEKIIAAGNLARRSPEAEKKTYIDALFQLDTKHKSLRHLTLRELMSNAAQDPRFITIVNEIFQDGKKENYEDFAQAQTQAIRTLHVLCPANRFALLEKVISRPNSSVEVTRAALMELIYLKSPDAEALINKTIEKNWLPQGFMPQAPQLRKLLALPIARDLCAGKAQK